ncbi:hypothetical protein GCM10027578_09940 [Spirosoma luteolum]
MRLSLPATLLLLSLLPALPTLAQSAATDESAVRAAITTLFDAMKAADSTRLKTVFAPQARLQSVANRQGAVSVSDDPISGFIRSVGKAPKGALDERLSGMTIHLDGDLATAWTPYSFYYNGALSHSGANAFTLVRLDGRWQILTIIDTRRRGN